MIAAWILYALLVGALVGAGALVLENLLRAHRLPTRWVWAGAMGLSLLWPMGHLIWRHLPRDAAPIPLPDPAMVAVLDPLAVQVTQGSFLRSLDEPIVWVWAFSTAVLLALFTLLLARTRRLRREWKDEEAGDQVVLFSEDLGPAVVGYVRPQIVLPGWCRGLEEETLNLILDHEREHLKAGDLRLILTAGVLPILFPWHLPVWWQYRRLRVAVEGDCDLRVLRKYPERTRSYMELLLHVGGQLPRTPALVAMLSDPEESLARRIRIMTMPFPKKPWIRGVVLAALVGLLVAVACLSPSPTDIPAADPELPPEIEIPPPPSVDEEANPELSAAPVFTPYTVQPDLKNRAEVARALEENYPPLLRDAGIGGTVQVWFFVDEEGVVQRLQIDEPSGHKALDDAALRVGSALQFTPALNRDKPVPVWISLPVTFSTRGSRGTGEPPPGSQSAERSEPVRIVIPPTPEELKRGIRSPLEEANKDITAAPTFTPYTIQPDIKNRTDVARALQENYPPLLRDAGIGGTVQVWFLIDEEGVVQRMQIAESSGHKALDDAALRVAREVRFTPALNRDERVPVWISLPITFTTR